MWPEAQKLLKKKGISVYRLSKATGIPYSTLSNYRLHHAEPSFINACKIADYLKVSLDDLRQKQE